MTPTVLTATPSDDGWVVEALARPKGIFGRGRILPFEKWRSEAVPASLLAASALHEMIETGSAVPNEAGCVLVGHAAAARLGSAEAKGLGFPVGIPFQFDIRASGVVGNPDFAVTWQFVQEGRRILVDVEGSCAKYGQSVYRLAEPMFGIIELARQIQAASDWDSRVSLTARLRDLLPQNPTAEVAGDPLLFSMRIAHATAFSLNVRLVDGVVDFDPIVLGLARDELDPADYQPIPLLPPTHASAFAKQFRADRDQRASYLVDRGVYLFIDPDLRPALKIVRSKQNGTPDEKLRFLMSPQRSLKEALLGEDPTELDVERVEHLFVESSEYSARVLSIGEWQPPDLPFIEGVPNNWLPERFSVVLGGKVISGRPDDIPSWLEAVSAAISQGASTVSVTGVDVPASESVRTALERLLPPDSPPEKSRDGKVTADRRSRSLYTLQSKPNFHSDLYARNLEKRPTKQRGMPTIRSTLKPHQVAGLSWLVAAYEFGWPGVLLADDMGLGKTIQALAFMAWLKEAGRLGRNRPALIVAPTSLLANWRNEHTLHLLPPGLGNPMVAYGGKLKDHRLGPGIEAERRSELLDIDAMRQSDWILTTYETLRDYQFSFARIPFSCMILDEVQKAKNPRSRISASLLSINSDFTIAMTGTPVENSLADLWTIADLVAPGLMPSLKDFLAEYKSDSEESLRNLSNRLLESQVSADGTAIPPFALRRMKSDIAADLPKKLPDAPGSTALQVDEMPRVQADKYSEIDAQAQAGRMSVLRALHDFRSVSLHPIDPAGLAEMEDEDYILQSARMRKAFSILETVRSANEKALIFVHSKKIQNVLSLLIERRFKCKPPMIVRGDVPAFRRQDIVDEFSALKGFAALILSPRAAGVGLNITAANHVIHLDRWWNPAVEDQCTDRAYRIGQKLPVTVYALAARHPIFGDRSYDIILNEVLERKRRLSKHVFVPSELQPSDFEGLFRRRTTATETSDIFLERADSMTPTAFEEWVKDVAIGAGLHARLTPTAWDGGADVVIRNGAGEVTHLLQCKHTNNISAELDGGLTDDIERMRENWQAPDAQLFGISNAAAFSSLVKKTAHQHGATLVGRSGLMALGAILAGAASN